LNATSCTETFEKTTLDKDISPEEECDRSHMDPASIGSRSPTMPVARTARGTGFAAGPLALLTSCSMLTGADDGTVELTFWSWAPGIEEVVQIWSEANPGIQVTVNVQGAGEEVVTKLLAASQAGHPPDLVQAEYQALTTFAARANVADLSASTTEAYEAI